MITELGRCSLGMLGRSAAVAVVAAPDHDDADDNNEGIGCVGTKPYYPASMIAPCITIVQS